MRPRHVALPCLLAILACTGNVFAEDKVFMVPVDTGEPVVHRGRILHVNTEDMKLILQASAQGTIELKLADIERIEASDTACSEAWKTYEADRRGNGGKDDGGRGGGLVEEGEGEAEAIPVTLAPKEFEQIKSLIARLGDEPEVEHTLRDLGQKATTQLAQALRNPERDLARERACRILGQIGGVAAVDDLLERVDDSHPGTRREAVIALWKLVPDDKRVVDKFRARACEEEVTEVMRVLVPALGKAAAADGKLRSLILDDSARAKGHMSPYYDACLALAGVEQVGDNLERWMRQGMLDDVFFATALANVPTKRDAAIAFLVGELDNAAGNQKREGEVITALQEITGQNFGYNDAESMAERAAAVKGWQTRWSKPTDHIGPPR